MAKNEENALQKEISKYNPGSASGWRFVELLGYGVGAANLPLGALLIVGSMVADAASCKKRQSEVAMPDDWLQKVSESPDVSKKGLAHLAKCLDKKGFVSVKDAVAWSEIEKTEAEKKAQEASRDNSLQHSGAQSLLSRAKTECPSLIPNISIKSALNSVSETTSKTRTWGSDLMGKARNKF